MSRATLTISSKNYSSWSLRGWLLCTMAGLEFDEKPVDIDEPVQPETHVRAAYELPPFHYLSRALALTAADEDDMDEEAS